MRRSVVLAFFFSFAACGPAAPNGPGGGSGSPDAAGASGACTQEGATTCNGTEFETCTNGMWTGTQSCPNSCDDTKGCIQCEPGGNACNGNTVVSCNNDGTFGGTIQTCDPTMPCVNGACSTTCTANGVQLIYVVDDANGLHSFDPTKIAQGANVAFQTIGTLNCQPGDPWPDLQDPLSPNATPFSMAVDRNAVAWVLYTSGQIFKVSTTNASCTGDSGYKYMSGTGAQNGMEVFGMGFVSDSQGSNTEHLFIGGGDASAKTGGKLALIDPTNPATATVLGNIKLPTNTESPELTGTGDAQLFGFFPGAKAAVVEQLSKTDGTNPSGSMTWPIPGGLGGQITAWAFAQYGNDWYIFVTTSDSTGLSTNSVVDQIDKTSGKVTTVLQNLSFEIVGAGVSTCAPTVVN